MKNKKLTKIIIVLSIFFITLIPITHRVHSAEKITYSRVTVASGDTLWSIASQYTNKGEDIREFIYNIKKLNNLDSAMITPGEELLIPNWLMLQLWLYLI